jgi:ubiquinone biosynthesis protein
VTPFADTLVVIGLWIVLGTATVVLATMVSLRLLGLRRGWGRAALAGVIGWTSALLLALAVADWQWGADGLALHIVAFGVPATMAVAVAFDLIARPGSLATGERAGLVVAPRPLRALRQRISVLLRYRELVRLARQEGFGPFLSARNTGDVPRDPAGVRLRRALEQAGGVYVKLGQIAATRVDLLPADVCRELGELQNRVAPEAADRMRTVLEEDFGRPVDEVFATFDWEPIAAASIGQTYGARLHTGEAVVVKVQRPDIDTVIERDLAALVLLADVAQRRTPIGQSIRSGEVLGQFAESLRAELDFHREVDAMAEMTTLLGEGSAVRVPRVHRQLCTRRILVQERFEGATLADNHLLESMAVDRRAIADKLLRTTLEQVLRMGFFHADPHPGNVFVFSDGSLGLIDFGAVGRLDPIQQSAVLEMLVALVQRDVGLLREAIERVVDVAETAPRERLERALARLVAQNVRATGTVEPTVFQDMIHLLGEFGLRLPGDLVLLSRVLVTVEGTIRVLAPEVSMVAAAAELMAPTTASPIIDHETALRDELMSALPHLRRLPDRIDRILTLGGRGDLRIRHVVDEDGRRIVRTLTNRALLAAIGSVWLVVAAILLVSTEDGPRVATGTGLFEVLGYLGLFAGTVLLLRVTAAVARDGTT